MPETPLQYNRKHVDIAITCDIDSAGAMEAQYAVRVVPAAIDPETGQQILDVGSGRVLLRGSLQGIEDPVEGTAVEQIRASVAAFLAARGW